MRAVDTNIIVRYLVGDDQKQHDAAFRLIGYHPVFVPRTVILETQWVLRSIYDMPIERIIPALRAFSGLAYVSLEDRALVAKAMDWAEAGMDFADALHLAASMGCDNLLTFDRRFMRAGKRLTGLTITEP